jgi:periplasmic protein CpxP/Spy
MFKHCVPALTIACLAAFLATSAVAQDNSTSQPQSPQAGAPSGHWQGHGRPDPAKRTEMLTKQLGLTSDQQPKVLDILKSEQSQMEKLHSDSSLSQDDRRSKMMDIHKSTDDQIRGVLNSDQQKKWDEMLSKREQWQGHHHGEQNPPANPPDQQ